MQIACAHCGKVTDKAAGAVNRARKAGLAIYCDRVCAGLGRRKPPKSVEQRKAEKRAYDAARREALADRIKAEKAAYYKRVHDPEKEALARKKRMPKHVEYCRRPEYVAWKREYDKEYRAKQDYGEFWESAILVNEIRAKALELAGGDYELRFSKGYFDRGTQQRRRAYDRLDREEPEIGALGDLERRERR